MIDFGFDKLALIGTVALIVIGPEKLPGVARIVGHWMGKMQRYVADVKAEVNRSMELDELKKMKTQLEQGVHEIGQSVSNEIHQAQADWQQGWHGDSHDLDPHNGNHEGLLPYPAYRRPRKNWRLKRSAMPRWYKQRHGIRSNALSGAARVARHRPR
jgi:sec-independent protein translocase protein TatB